MNQIETKSRLSTVDDNENDYNLRGAEHHFFNFMESVIGSMNSNGKTRTAEAYSSARSSFKKFSGDEDILLEQLSQEVMISYESWLKQRGVCNNSISFYMRILRAVYNRAVENGIVENRYPFKRVYTGVDKTVKRALPMAAIRKINTLDLRAEPTLDLARDMFMMSFMLRGMSFVDMAYLRKTDLRDGFVTYRRRKTNHRLSIQWTREMQTLLDKYHADDTPYLLPIMGNRIVNERAAYRNAGYRINRSLKKIAARAGVTIPLTLYVARHSWASAAYAKGIPLRVISEGMGHDSETTTLIYLAGLDTAAVDQANDLLLKALYR